MARERVDSINETVLALARKHGIVPLLEEKVALQEVLDDYVLKNKSFESETWQGTRVQGHRRTWNVKILRERLSPAFFKSIIKVSVDGAALDELVKQNKVKLETIEDALEEKPNEPYVKWTDKRKDIQAAGEAEAAKLSGMLS